MSHRSVLSITRSCLWSTVVAGPSRLVRRAGLHSTPITLRKRAKIERSEVVEEYDEPAEEDEDDLFSLDTPTSNQSSEVIRAELMGKIVNLVNTPRKERKLLTLGEKLPKGILGEIVRRTNEQEVDSLKGLLRAWRMLGLRVRETTANQIIERCRELGRPDLASELSDDPTQYGLPAVMSQQT